MKPVFDAYSRYYDLLYRDKDYSREAAYVASRLRAYAPAAVQLLDLGCGTGVHAGALAGMEYSVHGVDLSEGMIESALRRRSGLAPDIAARLTFSQGDIRDHRVARPADAVVSLFHVMSYQTSNADLRLALATAHAALSPGGVFFFDFWYGPAVLTQRPDVRVRRLEDEHIRVTRVAEPVLRTRENVVDVGFTVFVEDKVSGQLSELREVHPMRYLFLPELEDLVTPAFEILDIHAWMADRPPEPGDWAAAVTLRRRN